ncbi:unnamed protein product [Adineta ricciae]|uniref:ADP ribosyltransferase domain-containing protein n=1 Tax=Adineta ricciae TaxID=249248 RepID=A0A814VNN8_ADIRI|nr:unnamed protein product [Adineta ricciae]
MAESRTQHTATTDQSVVVSNSIDSSTKGNILHEPSDEIINKVIELGRISTNKLEQSIDTYTIKTPVVIVLTANIDQSDFGFQDLSKQLQDISPSTEWYTDQDQCIDSLTSANDINALLILYNYSYVDIIPLINFIPQIHAIYLFHHNRHQLNNENYAVGTWNKKVKSVYHHIEQMCYAIKQEFCQLSTDSSFSFSSSNSSISFDELDSSFMYTQLFKEILMELKYDKKKAKAVFIKYCRDPSTSVDFKSNDVDQFEKQYDENNAIWWYTKANFLFFNVNKALRNQDMKVLMKMAFFLQDLHNDIEKRCLEDNHRSKITVYRGQGLSSRKFEEMKKSKGALFSFNCFLSTSKNRLVAEMLAESVRSQNDTTGIIFQIEIDPRVSSASFTSVERFGNFPEEQEILFSMHSVFRIGDMKEVEERLWLVKLTATDKDDPDLQNLSGFLKKEVSFAEGWSRMAFLMQRIGNFDGALEIFRDLYDATNGDDQPSQVIQRIVIGESIVKSYLIKGKHGAARVYYELLLNFSLQHLPAGDFLIGLLYFKYGITFAQTGEYAASLENYVKALEIYQKHLPLDHRLYSIAYYFMGASQYEMGDFPSALTNYQKALQILEKCLPHNHPDLAQIYTSIASAYESLGEYSVAMPYAEKALEIQKRVLPSSHPNLGIAYNTIAVLHLSMGNNILAHSNLEISRNILENSQFSNNPIMIKIYTNIGVLQHSLRNYQEALSYFQKALAIVNKSLPSDHLSIASLHVNIGMIKSEMSDFSSAVEYLEKALEIYKEPDLVDHWEFGRAHLIMGSVHQRKADTYRELGLVQQSLGNFSSALCHYEEAVRIQKQSLGDHHPDLLPTYACIMLLKGLSGDLSGTMAINQNILQIKRATAALNNTSADYENNVMKRTIDLLQQQYPTVIQDCQNLDVYMKNYGAQNSFQNDLDDRTETDLCDIMNSTCRINKIIGQQIKFESELELDIDLSPWTNRSDVQLLSNICMRQNKQDELFIAKLQKYHLASQNSPNDESEAVHFNDLKEYVLQSCASSIDLLDTFRRLLPPNDISLAMQYNQVRDMLLRSHPVNHQYLAYTYNSTAFALYAMERYPEAFDCARESVTSAILAFGPDHPQSLAYENRLDIIIQKLSS